MTDRPNIEELIEMMRQNGEHAARTQRTADTIRDALRGLNPPPNISQVVVPPPTRGERAGWLLAVVCGITLAVCYFTNERVSDLRADMHAERLSRKAFNNWTAQEVTAVRSYITNGKLKPMQPRPRPTQETER